MRKLVPLRRILESAEEEGLDPDDIVCDPERVHVIQRDDIEPEPDEED